MSYGKLNYIDECNMRKEESEWQTKIFNKNTAEKLILTGFGKIKKGDVSLNGDYTNILREIPFEDLVEFVLKEKNKYSPYRIKEKYAENAGKLMQKNLSSLTYIKEAVRLNLNIDERLKFFMKNTKVANHLQFFEEEVALKLKALFI